MPVTSTPSTDLLLRVRGTVQGVGFRPFVHRTALRLGLRGWVRNDTDGVLIRAVGTPEGLAAFALTLRHDAPPAARVGAVEVSSAGNDEEPVGEAFDIGMSRTLDGPKRTAIPADLALCTDCRRELADPANRRADYPFINCTQCGPRYSLIEQLPYDRARTTMRAFTMCPECAHEYADPTDRRYHAEPNACPECGPLLSFTDAAGRPTGDHADALARAAAALCAGAIVAVKGVGGFHLMCDATDERAVAELRHRKHREEKPLAVMFPDLAALRRRATVSASAAGMLNSAAAPIVLVPVLPASDLAPNIAPGNPWIGALLPYAPLHVLLLRAVGRPLVATSANLSEEPLCADNTEALARLAGIADFHLAHDRAIARPVDDSVVRETAHGHAILLRRARGYAPAPLTLPGRLKEPVLCVGGHMKNTVALASGDQVLVSPHLGDLGNAATQAVFERTIAMLSELQGSRPGLVVHDLHPDYASTAYAQRLGRPTLAVQHHLAHVLACLLEHSCAPDDVLGVAWDGTGYGPDGTIWGGEFIRFRGGRATRFARLRPFRLPGGEAAVKDARRVALGLGHETDHATAVALRLGFKPSEQIPLQQMLRAGLNSPVCSSAGRLFDGFSALLGLCPRNRFEGQAPLLLEAASTRARASQDALRFTLGPSADGAATFDLDWAPALQQVLHEQRSPEILAAAFHRGLARAIVEVAHQAGCRQIALTGGCFQNALLHDLAAIGLRDAGFTVLEHRLLSPNDNSIAAGQALAALWNLTTVHRPVER